MSGARVELRGVTRQYAGAEGHDGPIVLRDVDHVFEAGTSTAVVGPSGSGKSTLLNLLGGLDVPTSGHVLVDGVDLAVLDERRLAQVRSKSIGFVFQSHHLLPQCTALENVLVPTLVAEPSIRKGATERAKELLARVGLAERAHHRPGQLSGGERQRVAVVRSLINGPSLLLADEPTGSLDALGAESLGALLRQLNEEQGVTLVAVTHSTALAETMGQVLTLEEGRLTTRESVR